MNKFRAILAAINTLGEGNFLKPAAKAPTYTFRLGCLNSLAEDFVEGDVAEMWICNEKNGCDLIRWEINGVKRMTYRQNKTINITSASEKDISECEQPSTMFEYRQDIHWKADDENQKDCPTADATDKNKDCGSYF